MSEEIEQQLAESNKKPINRGEAEVTLEDHEDRISKLEKQMENARLMLVSQIKINIRLMELANSSVKDAEALKRLLERLYPKEWQEIVERGE